MMLGASRKRKHNEELNAKSYLEKRLSDIAVSSNDRKKSHENVQKILDEMTDRFCDNSIFSKVLRKSGSYASSTKIKAADEFDYDIPIRTPESYRVEIVEDQNHTEINAQVFSGDNELTPSMIQQHLYDFMLVGAMSLNSFYQMGPQRQRAFDLRRAGGRARRRRPPNCQPKRTSVYVGDEFHGPAVTMHISIPRFHDISVDVSPSLKINEVTLRDYRWPRVETRQVLKPEVIEEIQSVGLHVVPKGQDVWKISVSRAERVLMSRIDHDNGCRKKCHMLLKSDFDEWNKRNNLDGISTYLFKHELFWLNEDKKRDWTQKQLVKRYCEMLQDLSNRLHEGKILNYFRSAENLLEGKDQLVLNRLAYLVTSRSDELIGMDKRFQYKRGVLRPLCHF